MNLVAVTVGLLGVILVIFSIPPFVGGRVGRRVEPFLDGLNGRPSRLVSADSTSWPSWVAAVLNKAGLLGHARLRERLEATGRAPDEITFRVEQVAWGGVAALLALLAGIATAATGLSSFSPTSLFAALVAGLGGAFARDWYLGREIRNRKAEILSQLPIAIDHMTLALMAGEAISGAIERVARGQGPLCEELARVGAEIRSGTTTVEALEALRSRIAHPLIARFVDALCTAIERGTSLTEVLRAQADDVRDSHRRALMELGGRREVLMLIPVVFLIMPVIVLFALFPGLVSLDLLVP